MAGNTSTKKEFGRVAEARAGTVRAPKAVGYGNHGGKNVGQMRGNAEPDKFSAPMNDGINAAIVGIGGLHDDIGEKSGFITDGYLDKGNTPFGEAAKFNFLPPGMEITNQVNSEIHEMPLRTLTGMSYPGDGWMPSPRDIPE